MQLQKAILAVERVYSRVECEICTYLTLKEGHIVAYAGRWNHEQWIKWDISGIPL
jgi:hypothetical protein